MPSTAYESAELCMRLFDLRREAKLREARDWFIRQFNPASVEEIMEVAHGPDSWKYRQTLSYWDQAAAYVVHGAIDPVMFQATNGEMLAAFCKIEHLLDELREATDMENYAQHMRKVADEWPGAAEAMASMREQFAAMGGGE